MPKSFNQKLKILYLQKLFTQASDEEHLLTVQDIITYLNRNGISAERKSVYDDIEALRQFGMDIVSVRGKNSGYFLASRELELPELKLLVDAVQASKFITHKKTNDLIKKLESFTSKYQANQLQRHVFVTNRVKTINESIYYNVDTLHAAIAQKKQILFQYFDYNVDKEKVFRKNGEKYQANPITLTWDDENYYLIAYSSKYKNYTHYRIDKMHNIEITDDRLQEPAKPFDTASYATKMFHMYAGESEEVKILFDNHLAGVVIDRFGKDVRLMKEDENHFSVNVHIAVSPNFFAWLLSFGDKATVLAPTSLRNEILSTAKSIIETYHA